MTTALFMVAVLLTNGNFADLDGKGRPVGWTMDRTHWSVAKSAAKDGANALVWTNADPNVRVTAMQPIRLEHGKMYSLDYDIRIDGRLCGDAKGGASAYVEYYGENGKWLSGTYGDVYKKTDDAWIHVCKISGEIPTNAVSYRVGLTANKGLTGRASFANVCVREFELPAAWDPVKARYRYADGQTHGRRVWIDRERRCIVDGKPFFPLGFYGGGGHMELIGKSPFNTLMLYGAPGRAKLDEARRNGLMVISGVNHFPLTPEGDATLAEYVRSVKDHPALLAWYAFDEAPITEVPRWEKRRDLLEKLDDDHPVWGVMNHPTWTGQQLGMFDVGGADPYPVPNEPLEQCTSWTENVVRRTGRRRAVWMVPQAFNWANYDRPFGRVPTREELRTMTRLCLDAGATGIIYFKFGDLLNNAKSPSTTFESRWADLVAVAEEVRVRLETGIR